ncbi:porphobilinogen synthase [Clostridium bornimense]|uniref:Delta-aminolevulinic acid dehydratase n=1 Tax=Clostridium bornimense TaxID=1216932 RepID=W6SF12_9CLOT|nr:porphobilinogen synthase [Clostridium bornimense]CDM68295.1 porphobilinogen synthase [Clostridium bornimense]
MFRRGRRLRENEKIRSLVRETNISKRDLIFPIFVVEGENIKKEISSLAGNYHWSIDRLPEVIEEVKEKEIGGIILFGIPSSKDLCGSEAYNDNGVIQRAIKKIREIDKDIYIITDVCMCEYTSHGHCGIVEGSEVNNDKTLEYLGKIALSHAKAGANMVAPSDMMDGRVGYIRNILDENGYYKVAIMSYSAKYCSAFYGPFREAANSAPQFGDRRGYQMDPANRREALVEVEEDINEGADIVMIKPALSYLDIVRDVRERVNIPICVYNVSGEFAMIKSAAKNGLIDEKRVTMEALISMKRAGADMIITYHALEVSKWLEEE